MSAISFRTTLTVCLLAAGPLYAQTPAVELEGYFARSETADDRALGSLPNLSAVCAPGAPDRIAIAAAAERMPATAREEMGASVHVVASTPNLPRR